MQDLDSAKFVIAREMELFTKHGYDWDGAGGLPMRTDVRQVMRWFIRSGTALDECLNEAVEPSVLLNREGTVELSFDNEGKELLLTLQCMNVVTYVQIYEDKQTSIEGVIRLDKIDDQTTLISLFEWLSRG